MKNLIKAEELKKKLDALRPISKEIELKVLQKFRLDWNFHSNNLEGNSLTYGETKMFLLHGITASGKPFKDYIEIKGHNEAINFVYEVAKSDREITENFIRELHFLILKEPYEVDAITQDGKAAKKTIAIGKYKTSQNHVKTKTGEIFYFAEPFETPAKMHDLIKWLAQESKKNDINPIILAAEFHYKFIRIHPFDDGNGRIARILMNLVLMRFGFPPVIIKTQDKENYFLSLRKADGRFIEDFIDYIAQNLVHSLEIMIRGASGEEIEEEDDLDKKIALLKAEFKENKVKIRSEEIIESLLDSLIPRIRDKFFNSCKKFDEFYSENEFTEMGIRENLSDKDRNKLIRFIYFHKHLLKKGMADLEYKISIDISFNLETYQISYLEKDIKDIIVKNYDQKISDTEIDLFIKKIREYHLQKLQLT